MRLTLHTDYALRTLLYLGIHTDRLTSIREVAQAYGISENHLVKIIHRLGQGGFIETIRGRNGGLRLGRPAASILIGDVVRYTEEDMALVNCMQPADPERPDMKPCILADACRLRGVLGEALGSFIAVLDRYTLADVITDRERQRLQAPTRM
ncbi:Rrf2 family transcriptional regulator [Komagataeibacter rhaeticus]|uniref:Rrf2 family transcriptional regulator n=1 Tax=Komagataeibacter rhaeticus TaxID=215221 RepID=A0A181CCT1_9PROT|nr:Rrf2 family transcriptional regulator [Komagataeibacter rhaeticus]ATU74178.1 Rrf2 family transcriptional regulator [Komagataeibacter xylinus]EGG75814.1 HTH-type transcriptional regulator nsrR [Gluconacetobacter sp. SXCC-1]KDU95887.1 Rrf2 family transcriptional regulator [Komagataeibacter rhaeticus AF1]MBL7240095.1 Rrf2 family transcriptional regulator [Komagataeibacter rhaeticus]PYD54839.1 Rrf2 family transcriptional regulator [Komagataeibacter rhaeticus]